MPRFLKSERLKSSLEFKAVFQQCRKVEDALLALYVQFEDKAGTGKFGISLGRALGKAHRRNRLKRRLREIYRVERERLRMGHRVVLIPKRSSAERSFKELQGSFLSLASRAGLLPRTREGSEK
jgi:ribonuclease P protein component